MKGKRKSNDLNEGPKNFKNIIGHDIWNGGCGTTSARQQSQRRILYNGFGSPSNDHSYSSANEGHYMDTGMSHTSGYAEDDVMLDFADPASILSRKEHRYGKKDDFRSIGTRYSRDYNYECLFRQTGSVSTQGEWSRRNSDSQELLGSIDESVEMFRCDLQHDPTSYLKDFPMGDEYSLRNSTDRGSIILDFQNSVSHMPSVMPSGFQIVNVVDMLGNQNCYPPDVDNPGGSVFRDTNFLHINGEASKNNSNGGVHLWSAPDSNGLVVLHFENQVAHGEASKNNSNGGVHLWSTPDSKGPVLLDFENQVVYGESSTNNPNGQVHLWSLADFKGPVVLDFENQDVHLLSTTVLTGSETTDNVNMLAVNNNYPHTFHRPDGALSQDRNSIHNNAKNSSSDVAHKPTQASKNVDFRKCRNIEWAPLSNSWTQTDVDLNCEGVSSNVSSRITNRRRRQTLPNVTSEGVSSYYIDIGDCDCSCQYCGAKFWYGERVQRSSTYQLPNYHKCCLEGKVRLGVEPHPPQYIRQLFKNLRFMENIRAYNQMFSMTSFGARVEESINNGRAPYVFKISGEIYH